MTKPAQQLRCRISDARELLHDRLALLEPGVGFGSGRSEDAAKVFGEGFEVGLSGLAPDRDRGQLAGYFLRFIRVTSSRHADSSNVGASTPTKGWPWQATSDLYHV
jgi:hypothetical protein